MVIPYTYYASIGPNTHLTAAYYNATPCSAKEQAGLAVRGGVI
jgi:hypothetical protein